MENTFEIKVLFPSASLTMTKAFKMETTKDEMIVHSLICVLPPSPYNTYRIKVRQETFRPVSAGRYFVVTIPMEFITKHSINM